MSKGKKIAELVKKHRKGCVIFLILVVVLLIVCVVFGVVRRRFQRRNVTQAVAMVQTTTLQKRDLATSVSVTGTIASADKREVVTNLKDIEIAEIPVAVGDYVNAGDTVIVFDDADLQEAYEETEDAYELELLKEKQTLSQAQGNVTEAQDAYEKGASEQAELVSGALSDYQDAKTGEAEALEAYESAQKQTKQAQKEYEALKEKKSELKSAMNQAEKEDRKKQASLEEAKATYESAEANVKYASQTDEKYSSLNQTYTDAYSALEQAQKEADESSKKAEQAKNAYDAIEQAKQAYEAAKEAEASAKEAYEKAAGQVSDKSSAYDKAVQTQTDTNEKNAEKIADSKESLTITGKEVQSSLSNQTKQLLQAQEKLGKCVVTSPISGYITALNVSVGDTYNAEDTLFVVQDTSNLIVEATVDEYDIASLQKDQEAVIKTDATGEEELSGIVTYVAVTPDESAGSSMGLQSTSSGSSYSIEISLSDKNDALRIGMTAKTSIILQSAKDVYAVAYDCVETDTEGNSYITVLDDTASSSAAKNGANGSGATRQIPVTVGLESDYYVEITGDGLEEGLRVVTPQTVGGSSDSDTKDSAMPGIGFPGGGSMPGGGSGSMPEGGNRGLSGRGAAPGGF